MSISFDITTLNEFVAKAPHAKIARIVMVVLIGYLAYMMAQLTWLFVPEATNSSSITAKPTSVANNKQNNQYNIDALVKLNLFGKADSKKVVPVQQPVQDAPQTKLKLVLSGVVASDIEEVAAAIIENNGKQATYGIGDTIKGTRAVLERVLSDRVLIKQSGRLETLMLDGFKYSKSNEKITTNRTTSAKSQTRNKADLKSARVVDQRRNAQVSDNVKTLRKDFSQNPAKITDYLKISPKRVSGKIVGYRLMPGKNSEFFKSSGLKSGDVAIQMNGYDLTEPVQAAQALRALKQEQEVSLLLDRNGENTEILFSINE